MKRAACTAGWIMLGLWLGGLALSALLIYLVVVAALVLIAHMED